MWICSDSTSVSLTCSSSSSSKTTLRLRAAHAVLPASCSSVAPEFVTVGCSSREARQTATTTLPWKLLQAQTNMGGGVLQVYNVTAVPYFPHHMKL
jgi:hypothetical protein